VNSSVDHIRSIDGSRSQTMRSLRMSTSPCSAEKKTPEMYGWLTAINLGCLYDVLVEAGFEDLGSLISYIKFDAA
jgi:hypothetical protein